MSFGFGVSDILTGLQLCVDINERCCTTANRVEVQYRELAVDVGHLKARLGSLQAAVSKVSSRTNGETFSLLLEEDSGAQTAIRLLEQESKELIGDFNATLQDCKDFLDQNRKYESRRANAVVNFTKGKGFESRIKSLRSRVMFHMQKIQLVLLPVQLELLTIIQDRVLEAVDRLHDLIEVLRDQLGQARAEPATLPEIPASLSGKFKAALDKDPPESYIDPEQIPLKEGFDAIYEHYRNSTLQFKNSESGLQTLEQYLNLLKAHWLLETVKRSHTFSRLRPSSLYRQAVAIVEKRIAGQYARSDTNIPETERVTRFGEQELCGLDDASFAIWPLSRKDPRPTPTKPSIFEEEILRLSLPKQDDDQNRELIFFRAGKNVLRLVESRISNETTQSTYNREFWINFHEDGLVPWYTFGPNEGKSAKFRIGLSNSRGGVPFIYEFESQNDVLRFQRAITGYLVAPPPFENVSCSYSVSKGGLIGFFRGHDQLDGQGSIQIWTDSPLSSASSQNISLWPSRGSSERGPTVNSRASYSGNTLMAESIRGANISITDHKSKRTIVAPRIAYPSALVAFTLSHGNYSIWFTELKSGMEITETIRRKARIIIRNKSSESKEFTTRRISVPESELGDCNLAVFGQPRHPLFANKTAVPELTCDFISFTFTSTKRMDDFAAHFRFAVENERKRTGNIQTADNDARRQANQPKKSGGKGISRESGRGNLYPSSPTILGSSPPHTGTIRSFSGVGWEKKSEAGGFENLALSKEILSESPLAEASPFNTPPDSLQNLVQRRDVQGVETLLTKNFTEAAKGKFSWLHDVVDLGYTPKDIANLLVDEEKESPWIVIPPPKRCNSTIQTDLHQPNCVHRGGTKLEANSKLSSDKEITDVLDSQYIKREVATSCGLAGIIPLSSDRQQWGGSVKFDPGRDAFVTYAFDRPDDQFSIQPSLARIGTALERLVNILSWLQQKGLCCSYFTTLKVSTTEETTELTRIPFFNVTNLLEEISSLRSDEQNKVAFRPALNAAEDILTLIYGKHTRSTLYDRIAHSQTVKKITLHRCAVATQSLCLGLLSYSEAHVAPIQPFFLGQALRTVHFQGFETSNSTSSFRAELVDLTCFGKMVGHPVVAFIASESGPSHKKLNLLATPEDIVDTWAPGRFIADRTSNEGTQIFAIQIGGGIVKPTADDPLLFHWEKGDLKSEDLTTAFDRRAKILVAATMLNSMCPLNQTESWQSCTLMENLGTREDRWRLNQMQASSQIGQYMVLQFSSTWVKQDGITLKARQLNASPGTIYLPFLESYWGLQVSLCTGVARRVLVREMLADVMAAYVEKRFPVPECWNTLLMEHNILDQFRGETLELWFRALPSEYQTSVVEIVRYVLKILGDTGYDGQKDELVVAWPFPEDPFHCFRIPCKRNQHLWAGALADSEVCATFAYIMPNCLEETNGQKCRQSRTSQWQNRAISLDTAVCPHKSNQELPDRGSSWVLQPRISYWIGKPGSDLMAKVLEPRERVEMRLSITRSLIPESYRRRMSSLQNTPFYRIREKQRTMEAHAKPVLILTANENARRIRPCNASSFGG